MPSNTFSRTLAAGAAILIGLLAGGCSSSRAEKPAVKGANERKQAPDFALQDSAGKTVRLSDYKGKVVLLDFWATWCGPCKVEIPWFIEFERTYKDRGFAVIGVAMDEEGWEVVKPFTEKLAINYRIVKGTDPVAATFGGVDSLPTTFLIDRDGKIAAAHVGLTGKDEFVDGIKQLLAQQATSLSPRSGIPALLVRPGLYSAELR